MNGYDVDDDMSDHETLPRAMFDAAGGYMPGRVRVCGRRSLHIVLDPAAGTARCPLCRCETAIDKCWNCGRRYVHTRPDPAGH